MNIVYMDYIRNYIPFFPIVSCKFRRMAGVRDLGFTASGMQGRF